MARVTVTRTTGSGSVLGVLGESSAACLSLKGKVCNDTSETQLHEQSTVPISQHENIP
jgi:hypothetical protein